MNNTFQTIRMGIVISVALFAFVQSAFAAPVLTPVVVTEIKESSAMLDVYVSNPSKNTCAWFEWTAGSSISSGTPVARQCFYGNGTIKTVLRDLVPGATYSYRAVAVEGGAMVYSPASSFQTVNPNTVSPAPSTYTQSQPAVSTQAGAQTGSVRTSAPVAVQKNVVTISSATQATPAIGAEGFTNGNSASIIGAGNGILPTTLIGWIMLLIMTLVAVLVGHMIYESAEKRREEREKKELELELEKEKNASKEVTE